VVASIIVLHTTLQNGSLLRTLDEHPQPQLVPPVEYYIGQGYYLLQDLPEAATFFIRIPQRYPHSSFSDDAYFYYVQCLDDLMAPRSEVAEAYAKYMELYPNGKHADLARQLAGTYRSNR
jgi:TolA-binding protein